MPSRSSKPPWPYPQSSAPSALPMLPPSCRTGTYTPCTSLLGIRAYQPGPNLRPKVNLVTQATQHSPSLGRTISREGELLSEADDFTQESSSQVEKNQRNETSSSLAKMPVGKDRTRWKAVRKGNYHTGQGSSGGEGRSEKPKPNTGRSTPTHQPSPRPRFWALSRLSLSPHWLRGHWREEESGAPHG